MGSLKVYLQEPDPSEYDSWRENSNFDFANLLEELKFYPDLEIHTSEEGLFNFIDRCFGEENTYQLNDYKYYLLEKYEKVNLINENIYKYRKYDKNYFYWNQEKSIRLENVLLPNLVEMKKIGSLNSPIIVFPNSFFSERELIPIVIDSNQQKGCPEIVCLNQQLIDNLKDFFLSNHTREYKKHEKHGESGIGGWSGESKLLSNEAETKELLKTAIGLKPKRLFNYDKARSLIIMFYFEGETPTNFYHGYHIAKDLLNKEISKHTELKTIINQLEKREKIKIL